MPAAIDATPARVPSQGIVRAGVPHSGSPGWISRLGQDAARLWAHLRYEREIARVSQRLSEMEDRTLKDIGIDRGQIEHLVRHGRPLD